MSVPQPTQRFNVTEPTIDLYLGHARDKSLKSVECDYIELDKPYDPDNPEPQYKARHIAPDGSEITTVSITPDDLEEAIGNWLSPA